MKVNNLTSLSNYLNIVKKLCRCRSYSLLLDNLYNQITNYHTAKV